MASWSHEMGGSLPGCRHEYKLPDTVLPIKEAEFRQVLSPEFMVKTRVGTGSPQPAEVERMLAEAGRL